MVDKGEKIKREEECLMIKTVEIYSQHNYTTGEEKKREKDKRNAEWSKACRNNAKCSIIIMRKPLLWI
jgi:hypothetical protein